MNSAGHEVNQKRQFLGLLLVLCLVFSNAYRLKWNTEELTVLRMAEENLTWPSRHPDMDRALNIHRRCVRSWPIPYCCSVSSASCVFCLDRAFSFFSSERSAPATVRVGVRVCLGTDHHARLGLRGQSAELLQRPASPRSVSLVLSACTPVASPVRPLFPGEATQPSRSARSHSCHAEPWRLQHHTRQRNLPPCLPVGSRARCRVQRGEGMGVRLPEQRF